MEDLDSLEQELLLRWWKHHMTMDQRHKLMRDMPLMYNKFMGREIMKVVNTREGE